MFLPEGGSLRWRGFLAFPYMSNLGVAKPTWLTPATLRTPLPPDAHCISMAGAGGGA